MLNYTRLCFCCSRAGFANKPGFFRIVEGSFGSNTRSYPFEADSGAGCPHETIRSLRIFLLQMEFCHASTQRRVSSSAELVCVATVHPGVATGIGGISWAVVFLPAKWTLLLQSLGYPDFDWSVSTSQRERHLAPGSPWTRVIVADRHVSAALAVWRAESWCIEREPSLSVSTDLASLRSADSLLQLSRMSDLNRMIPHRALQRLH